MKLLGGSARGMNLVSLPGRDTRPALARVRNSLFNILAPRLDGSRVLDLFAGTGSLGLEALSRGAAAATFVDNDRRCCDAIRASLAKMRMADRGEVVCGDVFQGCGRGLLAPTGGSRAEARSHDGSDLIFIAPPYSLYMGPVTAPRMVELVERLLRDALAPEGLTICEHRRREGLAREPAGGRVVDRREYGQTVLTIYSRASP